MDVSRRTVLGGMLAPLIALPELSFAQSYTDNSFVVVLDHIPHSLPPALAAEVLNVFFARGIPVTATLPCPVAAQPDRAYVALFTTLALQERGLFEVALEVEGLAAAERYFQLRAAMDLRDCLSADAPAPIVTLLDRSAEPALDPYALRAAGFRVLLQPALESEGQGGFQAVDWGIARLSGAQRADIMASPDSLALGSDPATPMQAFYLSFDGAAGLESAEIIAQAEAWAERLHRAMLEAPVFLTRPMDHLLQGNPGASKYVGLVLDFGAGSPTSSMARFAEKLDLAGLPYTILPDAAADAPPPAADTCEPSPTARCVVVDAAHPLAPNSLAEIVATRGSTAPFWSGPRADGRFHAFLQPYGATDFTRMMAQDPLTDMLLLIDGTGLEAPIRQDALIQKFLQAKWDGKARFYSIDGYVAQTLAPDVVLGRFWSHTRRQVSDPPSPQAVSAAERQLFLQDARLAWGFIARYSHETTGICSGTVQSGARETINQWVSLWDVASQLQGIMAATALGLIEGAAAQNRVALVLENLPVVSLQGRTLPPALFRADAPDQARPEFNACDTGRFLMALSAVVRAGLATQAQADKLVAQWDIAEIIREAQPYDYSNGRWENAANSHCTQYTRNGYIGWGFAVNPVYPALRDPGSGDQRIGLLYAAANIGHFGTEPLLLEGLEVGYSRESKYLSEVLFDAQLSWFERTGQYKCVSETPLNFAPWFSYQGLRVDRQGAESWVISTPSNLAAYNTPAFYERADIISAKAAFLWAAEYPHAFTRDVLALVRAQARLEAGFSVGVSAATMQAVPDYSDVNTNGIILSAIAKILRAD